LLAAAAITLVALRRETEPPPETDPFPLAPLATSPFLNTGPDARYLGSEACRACHPGPTASFRRTGMGRSMAAVDSRREPPDASFDHPASKRRYQVYRKDDQVWHRELLLTKGPEEVVLSEYPLKYVVGSGRHSLTYLVEANGFLMESPLTWFKSQGGWAMSPGYDDPRQPGFQRAVGENCLVCHAGQSEAIGGSWNRMRVSEAAIGCERCHGPGSLHVELHANRKRRSDQPAAGIDYTIVNPAHLSRDLAEAICQQCHLRPTAVVATRGRKLSDFRPGLPLQDFQHAYLLEKDTTMTVVGHVEQLHLSRCYQASGTLSCLTCHDPHDAPRLEKHDRSHNAVCLTCHQPQRCTVDKTRRQKESPENNCVYCHMPRSPTEIVHLAFTHHRIGIHEKRPDADGQAAPGQNRAQLKSFFDLSRLSEGDRRRSLGLGYLEVADRENDAAQKTGYQAQALELLSGVRKAGMRDPAVDVGLARLRSDMKAGEFLAYVESALEHPQLSGVDRCNALALLANDRAGRGRREEARRTLQQLIQLRRHAVDWLLLGDCEGALGNQAASEEAMATAVQINPRLWMVHQHLAEYYRRQGNLKRSAWHQQRAVP
jgi:hypothetical protein